MASDAAAMKSRKAVSRANPLLALAIVTLGSAAAAGMQEAVPNPAKAGFEIALIAPNTSGTAATGGIRFQPKGGELPSGRWR